MALGPGVILVRVNVGLIVLLVLVAGCGGRSCDWIRPSDPKGPGPAHVEKLTLSLPEHPGISGAASIGDGRAVLVAERRSDLLVVTLADGRLVGQVPIDGLDPARDLESVAYLSDGSFVMGTEAGADDRPTDPLYKVTSEGSSATLVETLTLSYAPWDMLMGSNHGVEGLCVAGDWLLAGVEEVIEQGGGRIAPLGVLALSGGGWRPFGIQLTTSKGKIAGLYCSQQTADGPIEVWAIERHFGVSRVLHFEITELTSTPEGHYSLLTAEVVVDLAPLQDDLPNFEGLIRLDDGRFWLVSDNDYGGVSGPTVVWIVTP